MPSITSAAVEANPKRVWMRGVVFVIISFYSTAVRASSGLVGALIRNQAT
jgi:hypothetical protein